MLTLPPPTAAPGAHVEAPLVVFEADARGVPRLAPYLREVWQRRAFALQLARATLKAQHYDTFFGRVWTILNPLLLAGIYYLLIAVVIRAEVEPLQYIGVLIAGLFAFFYTRTAIMLGSASVVGGAGLILNSAFPRLLLPFSAMISAAMRYAPMLGVYAVFHLAAGFPVGPQLFLLVPVFLVQTVFSAGALLLAAWATVYVRDLRSFLPYAMRIWLYTSPVLWTVDQVPDSVQPFLAFNPLYPILGSWQAILVDGDVPDVMLMVYGAAWALVTLALGTWIFLSRERDFAVRI